MSPEEMVLQAALNALLHALQPLVAPDLAATSVEYVECFGLHTMGAR